MTKPRFPHGFWTTYTLLEAAEPSGSTLHAPILRAILEGAQALPAPDAPHGAAADEWVTNFGSAIDREISRLRTLRDRMLAEQLAINLKEYGAATFFPQPAGPVPTPDEARAIVAHIQSLMAQHPNDTLELNTIRPEIRHKSPRPATLELRVWDGIGQPERHTVVRMEVATALVIAGAFNLDTKTLLNGFPATAATADTMRALGHEAAIQAALSPSPA